MSTDHLSTVLAAFPPAPTPGTPWYDALVRYAEQTFGPLAPAVGEERTEIDGLPDGWQGGLLERLGEAVVALPPDAAEPLWRPVLDLGAAPRGWTERLTMTVTRYAAAPGGNPAVLDTWRRMVRYALGHPAWAPGAPGTIRAYNSGSSWRPLLGFTNVVGVYGWTDEQRPAFDAVQLEILEWADCYLTEPSSVRWFAGLLSKPALSSIALPGLVRLADASRAHPRAFWGHSQQGEEVVLNVSALVAHVWAERRADLRDPTTRAAFEALLQPLVVRQDPDALVVADEVRRVGL